METNEFKDKVAAGTLSRRDINKVLAAAGVAVVTMPLAPKVARADEQAIYFTWSGYDIPEIFPSYIEKYGEAPHTPIFGDNEETFTKIRAGFVVDITHPCSSMVARWRDAGILQPIDTSMLSNWGDVFDELKVLQGTQDSAGQWFAPFDWGQTSITYRKDLVDLQGEEESWSLLWDERYKGKLSMLDAAEDAWWCAAIYAGVDVNNVTDADFIKVRKLLTEQRPLLRFYSSDMTSVGQALASGELVAAMTWNGTPLELKNQGLDVAFAKVKEGALTWVCGMVLAANAPNYDKAHDLIDALISPEAGIFLITDYGYGHGNKKAFETVSEDDLLARGLAKDPLELLSKGVFAPSAPPDVKSRMETQWSEITAGF